MANLEKSGASARIFNNLLERMPCFAFDEDFRRHGLTVITAAH
jgi:hypothetical protein